MCFTEIGAKTVSVDESAQTQTVDDVHIGVFFERTGYYTDYYKGMHIQRHILSNLTFGLLYDSVCEKDENEIDRQYWVVTDPKISAQDICDLEKNTPDRKTQFTNIALLYSLFDANNEKSNPHIVKKFYFEGCGADSSFFQKNYDSCHNLKPSLVVEQRDDERVRGADMGVGMYGVVGVVSKAIDIIHSACVNIVEEMPSKSIKFHFHIFGFGRGATCAILFSYLLTRSIDMLDPPLIDKEFSNYSCNPRFCFNDGQVLLLGRPLCGSIVIDFLGLYDTVCSVGLLTDSSGKPKYDYYSGSTELSSHMDAMLMSLFWGVVVGMLGSPEAGELAGELEGAFAGAVASTFSTEVTARTYEAVINGQIDSYSENKTQYDTVQQYCQNLGSIKEDRIKYIFHLCAMDEYRENYALVSMGNASKELNSNTMEVMIPGSHEDVGGGGINRDMSTAYELEDNVYICYHNHISPTIGRASRVLSSNGTPSRSYSDVTLAIMINQSECSFFGDIPEQHNYKSDKLLRYVGDQMMMELKRIKKGMRYWISPPCISENKNKPDYSKDYEYLFSHYLHFSASNTEPNQPNYECDSDYTICRKAFVSPTSNGATSCKMYVLEGDEIILFKKCSLIDYISYITKAKAKVIWIE